VCVFEGGSREQDYSFGLRVFPLKYREEGDHVKGVYRFWRRIWACAREGVDDDKNMESQHKESGTIFL